MRISVDEMIDIAACGLGGDSSKLLKKHFRIYGNYGRLKQIITTELIGRNARLLALESQIEKLKAEIESSRQLNLFSLKE